MDTIVNNNIIGVKKTILAVNRGWLKHRYWDVFDWNVELEHINACDLDYDIIIYMFGKTAKILKF